MTDLHPGSLVSVFDNGGSIAVGSGTVDANGGWSFPVSLVGDGNHDLVAVNTDGAENVGTSGSVRIYLDTTAPTIPMATVGFLTNQPTQSLLGFPQDDNLGSTYYVYDNGGAAPIASGTWTLNGFVEPTVNLVGDGIHSLVIKTTDNAGNTGSSDPVVFQLDTTAPLVTISSPGILTNAANHTITGTAADLHLGSTVSVFDNMGTVALGSGTIDGTGHWSIDVTLAGDGTHSLVAQSTDVVGNTGSSAAVVDVLDTVAPAVSISTAGVLTNQTAQTISGTATDLHIGTIVAVFDNSGTIALGSGTIDGNGNWSAAITLSGDGDHSLVARSTDNAGNTGVSAAIVDTLDATAPAVAFMTTAGLTNQPTQTISGTLADVHSSGVVTLYEGSSTTAIATAPVQSDGSWSALVYLGADGTHSIEARSVDTAGNTGNATETFIVDTTPPVVAVSSTGGLTNQTSQPIAGTGEAGTLITVFDGAVSLGTTTVDPLGAWSRTVTITGDGTHAISATDLDAAGNTGFSVSVPFLLDTTPPSVAITSAGVLTNSAFQTISGTGEIGTAIQLFDGAVSIGDTTVDVTGTWSAGVSLLSGQGIHSVIAKDTDAAGNTGSSAAVNYTLDTIAPSVAITTTGVLTNNRTQTINGTGEAGTTIRIYSGTMDLGTTLVATNGTWSRSVQLLDTQGSQAVTAVDTDAAGNASTSAAVTFTYDSVAPIVAISSAGGPVNQSTQTISGTGEANTTVTLFDGLTSLGSTTVGSNGTWTRSVTLANVQGVHNITARDPDPIGNVGTSSIVPFILDTVAPAVTITSAGGLTNQRTQTISGTGQAGTQVSLFKGGVLQGTTGVAADGTWSATITFTLPLVTFNIVAKDTDAAGNVGISAPVSFTYDNVAPSVAISGTGGLTNQPFQTVSGTSSDANPGTTVNIFDNGGALPLASAMVQSNGTWAVPVTFTGDGTHSLVATYVDAVSNIGTSGAVVYTLDTVAPLVAITSAGGLTKLSAQTVTGTGQANTAVTVFDGATQVGTTTVAANGTWSAAVTLVGQGAHTMTATDTDAAGNTGVSTGVGYTLDTIAPAVAITSAGGLVKQRTQIVTGTGEAGTLVSIVKGAVVLGTATVAADGTWSTTVILGNVTPVQNLVARDTDAAGNVGTSAAVSFLVDTAAPTVGITSAGGLTNQPAQTVSGTSADANPGTMVSLYDNNSATVIATAAVQTDGTWSTTVTLAGDGTHSLVAKYADAVGNLGTSAARLYTLDTLAPTVSITSPGVPTNLAAQKVSGTSSDLNPGTTVSIFDNTTAAALATATIQAGGAWSAPVTLIGDGDHGIVAIYTDAAGNTGTSAAVHYTLDVSAPNVFISSTGGATNQPDQTISGTGEANTTVNVFDGATLLGSTTVAADGTWNKPVTLAGDGSHTIQATDTDTAGNVGSSNVVGFTLDATAPVVAITSAGGPTNATIQTISGTGEAGTTVEVFDGTEVVGSADVDVVTGTWSVAIPLVPGDGAHVITATDTDESGNVGTSTPVVYTLDTVTPTVAITTIGSATRVPTQVISGTGEANSVVTIYDGATAIGSTTVVANGSWTTSVTMLPDQGNHSISAVDTDAAGNSGFSTPVTFLLDTIAPAVAIGSAGGLTKSRAQVVAGTGEANTIVAIFDGLTSLGTAQVDTDGVWSKAVTLTNTQGLHSVTAQDVDSVGNIGTSGIIPFTLDTIAPTVVITSAGGAVNQLTQVVSGTGEAGTEVTVYKKGATVMGTTTVGNDGTWSTTVTLGATLVAQKLVAKGVDLAGNIGSSPLVTYVVDITAPSVAITTVGSATTQPTQTIVGTSADVNPGTTVFIFDNGAASPLATAAVQADGSWSTSVTLPDLGNNSLVAKYPDAAGNIGVSAASVFTLVSPIAGVVTHGASADFTAGGVGVMSSGVGNAGTAAGAIDLAAVGGDRVGGSDLRGQTGWQAPVQSGFVTAGGGGEAGLDPMVLDLIFATTGTNISIWNITQ